MAQGPLACPSNFQVPSNDFQPHCFLIKCSHRGQILPSHFEALINQHQANVIVLRYGMRSWPITVNNGSFGDGWDEYCRDNIVATHDMVMLRHAGRLIFDVLHLCELQQQVYLPWTVLLPNLLQNATYHEQDHRRSPIIQHRVASSLEPDFCQCISDSHCFYQIFNSSTPNTLKIPKFTDHFLNGMKTPTILIKTGHNTAKIGVKGNRLKKNWRSFVLRHQLQHNDFLVFVPESQNTFAVLIFDYNGTEKIFPWYQTVTI